MLEGLIKALKSGSERRTHWLFRKEKSGDERLTDLIVKWESMSPNAIDNMRRAAQQAQLEVYQHQLQPQPSLGGWNNAFWENSIGTATSTLTNITG